MGALIVCFLLLLSVSHTSALRWWPYIQTATSNDQRGRNERASCYWRRWFPWNAGKLHFNRRISCSSEITIDELFMNFHQLEKGIFLGLFKLQDLFWTIQISVWLFRKFLFSMWFSIIFLYVLWDSCYFLFKFIWMLFSNFSNCIFWWIISVWTSGLWEHAAMSVYCSHPVFPIGRR